jgi:hypothetical protein
VLGIWKKWLALPSVAGRSDGMNAFAARRASRLLHEAMHFNTSSAEQRQEIDFAEWGGLLKSLLPPDQLLDIKEFDGASNILGVGAPIGKASTWKTRGDNARKAKLQGDSGVWTDATIATLPSWARFLLPLMLCGAYLLVYAMSFRQLQQHPWWELLLLGAGWFAWTGSIWILLILAFFAALLVCDTYWLISVRSRQSVLRGPR